MWRNVLKQITKQAARVLWNSHDCSKKEIKSGNGAGEGETLDLHVWLMWAQRVDEYHQTCVECVVVDTAITATVTSPTG